jgi:integrase
MGKVRSSTAQEYKALIKAEILPALGSRKVAAVTYSDIDRLHRKISDRAPYRANRCTAVLSKMFSLSIKWRMRPDNPCKGIERNQEAKRDRYLSGGELPALLSALDSHGDQQAANIFRLLLLTGARRGEVLGAKWNEIDLDSGVWTKAASTTKQKKLHRLPLSEPAIELLREIHAEGRKGEYVFPGKGGAPRVDIKKPWAAVIKAAGISGLRMHDLRHSHASLLVNEGLGLPTIGALLGHSNAATTHRYSHLIDDTLRAATKKSGRFSGTPDRVAGRSLNFIVNRETHDPSRI